MRSDASVRKRATTVVTQQNRSDNKNVCATGVHQEKSGSLSANASVQSENSSELQYNNILPVDVMLYYVFVCKCEVVAIRGTHRMSSRLAQYQTAPS